MSKRSLAGFLTMLVMVLAMTLGMAGALAAEWTEGRSPAQPYLHVPAADLEKSIGYMMLYPKETKPAENFCDVLDVYLPREDVKPGSGEVHLFLNGTEIFSAAFDDTAYVEQRNMNEDELDGLLWGGGTVFVVHLPSSLRLNGDYYVTLDEKCIFTADETVWNPAILSTDAWKPKIEGEYGVELLNYMREGVAPAVTPAVADGESGGEDAETDESGETAEAETAAVEAVDTPVMESVARGRRKGDRVSFRLVLGGEAASAVIYDPDITIDFDNFEITSTGTYTGTVIADYPGYWGIVFLDAQGNMLKLVELGY